MRSKLERVKEELRARNIDYLILAPGSNMLYLTGFDEEQMERPLFYIVTQNEEFFVVPKLYEEQLSNHNLIVYTDGENPFKKIPIQKGRVVAIDDTMWSSFTIDILNYFSPSQLVKSSEVLKEIRMIKSQEEIEILREGVKIAEEAFLETINLIREGMKEVEISNLLIQKFSERGVKPSFEPIITSGPNTSMPHLRATNRKVARNEVIIFDFGIRYKGYATDTTRVVSIGKPNEDVLKIHEIVREAQERAEEYVSEKVETSEVDKIARQTISKYGFGAYFIHRTGHGIGIDVHEDPYISSDYKRPIKNNMTFTIEPGIYLPGKFGIRIEDMVFVNDKGISMNKLDKNIFTL